MTAHRRPTTSYLAAIRVDRTLGITGRATLCGTPTPYRDLGDGTYIAVHT